MEMVVKKLHWKRYYCKNGGMRRRGETWVASLEAARGLAMMTGAGDRRLKKPQGPNEIKMTTAAAALKWIHATSGSLGCSIDSEIACVYIYESMYVCAFNSQEEVP